MTANAIETLRLLTEERAPAYGDALALVEALLEDMKRIASPDELTGDGQVESVLENPVGIAARELKARMRIAADAVRRVETGQ